MVNFELSSNQWQLWQQRKSLAQMDLSAFEEFNKAALKRDQSLAQNFLRKRQNRKVSAKDPVDVLVAGGFHSAGLTARFKNKNIAYLVMMPRLNSKQTQSGS